MKIFSWSGIYSAVTTPFTEKGSIDQDMFGKQVLHQVKSGVDAIIIGGSLGESSTLSHDDRIELFSIAQTILHPDVPILINIAEGSTKKATDLAQLAELSGAHGFMLLPPMMYKASATEVVDFFIEVARNTSLPIMIYNNPIDYKIEVTPQMFEILLKQENIQAVKESTRDVSNVTRLRNIFGDRLKILTGVDTIAMESIVMGADGWVAGLVNAFPEETVAIYHLLKKERIEEAATIYRWFMPLLELDIDPQLVQNIKLAASLVGLGNEEVRLPRQKLSGDRRKQVIKIIEHALSSRPYLPEYLKE